MQSFGMKISWPLSLISFCTTSIQTSCYLNMGGGEASFFDHLSHAGIGELGLDVGQYLCKLINGSLLNQYPIFISSLQQPPTRFALKMVHPKCRSVLHSTISFKYFNIRSELLDDEFNIDSDNISNFRVFLNKISRGAQKVAIGEVHGF